uniref:hypothetical protein n=1 Tax=Agathobacter sp. TaxID=2021311 RepID=UPI0040572CE0
MFPGLLRRCAGTDLPQGIGVLERRMHVLAKGYFLAKVGCKEDDEMSESAVLDSQRMFEHACAFCDCAKFCEVEPNNIEYRMRSHTVSGIVNSAFACEVFIKTLLVFNGRTVAEIKGHKLKTLWEEFRTLDNETAVLVEERMRKWFNSSNENMFDELLSEASNAFEYWLDFPNSFLLHTSLNK